MDATMAKWLAAAIQRALFCVPRERQRSFLDCVLLDVAENALAVVGMDGDRGVISKITTSGTIWALPKGSWLLPREKARILVEALRVFVREKGDRESVSAIRTYEEDPNIRLLVPLTAGTMGEELNLRLNPATGYPEWRKIEGVQRPFPTRFEIKAKDMVFILGELKKRKPNASVIRVGIGVNGSRDGETTGPGVFWRVGSQSQHEEIPHMVDFQGPPAWAAVRITHLEGAARMLGGKISLGISENPNGPISLGRESGKKGSSILIIINTTPWLG